MTPLKRSSVMLGSSPAVRAPCFFDGSVAVTLSPGPEDPSWGHSLRDASDALDLPRVSAVGPTFAPSSSPSHCPLLPPLRRIPSRAEPPNSSPARCTRSAPLSPDAATPTSLPSAGFVQSSKVGIRPGACCPARNQQTPAGPPSPPAAQSQESAPHGQAWPLLTSRGRWCCNVLVLPPGS